MSQLHKILQYRSKPIDQRFPGFYRALVVETNDPLNMSRIRFRCPDMHNEDMKPEDCPWALPCPSFGGMNSGSFTHPIIGDWVWIGFEKQHPYGPIYFGSADPTRARLYVLGQVNTRTVQPMVGDSIEDYDDKYLPKDGRPMQHGVFDRYGNIDISSYVGYYPIEHDTIPPPSGVDTVTKKEFYRSSRPLVNDPDKKYMLRITKYGNGLLLSDQGYWWKKDGEFGEMDGDSNSDSEHYAERWLYYQDAINSGSVSGDNRRVVLFSRYGHSLELRDVGYAQPGPIDNKSRDNEPGPNKYLSKETVRDQRYVRLKSKSGFTLELNDSGGKFGKASARNMLDEADLDEALSKVWRGRDSRFARLSTPYGYKIVLDDRGSDREDPESLESPRGNGILLKGRRSPREGETPRGFYFEFNENDEANHTTWGTPKGYTIELNDRYGYILLTASAGHDFAAEYKGLSDNEFVGKPTMLTNPELTSHHIKIDHVNEYIRFKTRAGNGIDHEGSQTSNSGINQGFEARDSTRGDGPWVELVDGDNRGLWFSRKNGLSIIRGKEGSNMAIWIDDANGDISIYNGRGNVNIYSNLNVNIKSAQSINLDANGPISLKSAGDIIMQSRGSKLTVSDNLLASNDIRANRLYAMVTEVPSPGGSTANSVQQISMPPSTHPSDRGKIYNEPIEQCPPDEINHSV